MLVYYVKGCGFSAVTLKLFDTYGPNDPRPKFFSFLKRSLKEKAKVDFSPGDQKLDVIFIEDVVDAYRKAIDYLANQSQARHDIFFIGSGKGLKLKDIVAAFEDVVGEKLDVNWGGREYRPREIMMAEADVSKAKEVLHWEPAYSLKQGLTKMMSEEQKAQ